MFQKFKRILTILMFVEIGLLVLLGILTTWWVPLAEVFLSFLCGAFVGTRHGITAPQDLGTAPTVFERTAGTFAAVLLILPGMLTDLIGLILWFGPTRKSMGKRAVKWAASRSGGAFGPEGFVPGAVPNASGAIEAEVIDVRTVSDS